MIPNNPAFFGLKKAVTNIAPESMQTFSTVPHPGLQVFYSPIWGQKQQNGVYKCPELFDEGHSQEMINQNIERFLTMASNTSNWTSDGQQSLQNDKRINSALPQLLSGALALGNHQGGSGEGSGFLSRVPSCPCCLLLPLFSHCSPQAESILQLISASKRSVECT